MKIRRLALSCVGLVLMPAWAKAAPVGAEYMLVDLTKSKTVTYHASAEELPRPLGDRFYKTDAMLFRRVPAAGRVWRMGSPSREDGRPDAARADKERAHLVRLSTDYYLAVYETTQGQWKRLVGELPAGCGPVTNDVCPVTGMRYAEVRGYAADLHWPKTGHAVSKTSAAGRFAVLTGVDVDLPTEAQWEFACRGGTVTAYPNGENSMTAETLSKFAIWSGNAPVVGGKKTCAEVGLRNPNGYGLFDMIGNVREMCVDFPEKFYRAVLEEDPIGTNAAWQTAWRAGSLKVRGSCCVDEIAVWDDAYGSRVRRHRSAYRGAEWCDVAGTRDVLNGFRFAAPVGAWPSVDATGGRCVSAEAFDLDDPAVAELAASFLADRLDGKREKVLLDTDIGADLDDQAAILYLLKEPRCDLLGVTTVGWSPELRASMVSAICRDAGRADVPIHPGCPVSLRGRIRYEKDNAGFRKTLAGWPHDKFERNNTAIEFMRRTIRANPGEVTLLAIGTFTNLGVLFTVDPELPPLLKRLVVMGGNFGGYAEWNAVSDPVATCIVYGGNGALRPPLHLSVTSDVTGKTRMSEADARKLFASDASLKIVGAFAESWLASHHGACFSDAVAAVCVFYPEVCRYRSVFAHVPIEGPSAGWTLQTGWWDGAALKNERKCHVYTVGIDCPLFEKIYRKTITNF